MAFTLNGTIIEQTGTDANISGLSGISGVTVEGDVYTLNSPITEINVGGNLTIADYETLQLDDNVNLSRPNGGVLTMKPFSTIEIIGNSRGADIVNNTFRGGFTFNAEILELGGGRIQTPVFREAPNGRSDTFSCYSPDFDNGTGGGVTFNIEGLTLIYEPVTSAKLYATAASQLDNIHLKRFGVNFVELQVGFNNGSETKAFDKLIFDNVEQLSTRGGNTQVGSVFLLTSPRYLFPTDFTISLVNLRSDVEFLELRDIESIGVGQWDGTITNTFRGVRTTSTQKRTYLSGATPVSGINTVYSPTGSIGVEVTETSGVDGVSEQVLVYGEIQPSGVFFTGVIPQETWTVRAVGYNDRIPSESFILLDNQSPTTSDQGIQVVKSPVNEVDKSIVDAYSELENTSKLHDRSVSFVVDNPVGLSTWLLTQNGETIDAGSYNLTIDATAASVFAFDGTTITIKASTFTGNITTTGTVTLNNGSTVSGGIIDINGDSFLTFAGVDSWKVYANQNDANLEQNELGTGLGSEIYRFTFASSTTYFIRLTVGTDTLFKTSTPTESGETVVELTIAGLLTSLPANVDKAVTSSVDGIDLPATIASGVESAILNDTDGQAVITAIVNAIDNTNVDEVALVAAIRADMERSGGSLDTILADTNELQTNQGDWLTADVSGLATQVSVDALNNFDPATDQVIVATNNDKTDYELANNAITSNKVATGAFNNSSFTTGYFNSINSEVDTALNDYDAPTKAELDAAQASIEADIAAIPSTDISDLETKVEADARQALLIAEHDQTQTNISNIASYDDTVLIGKVDDIKAKTDTLENYDDTLVNTKLDAIPTTDSVADLTPVLTAISNLNDIDTAAIRTELATELARLDTNVSSVAYDDTTLTALVNSLPTLSEMEASSLLTAVADITGLSTHDAADVVTALQVVSNDFKYDDTTLINKVDTIDTVVDSIKSKTDTLENTDLTGIALTSDIETARYTITALINGLNNLSSTDVTNSVPTTAEIEAALLNEGDSQQLIDAIVQAIGNINTDEIALVAAIRADLERTGGSLDIIDGVADAIKTKVDTLSTKEEISTQVVSDLKPDLTIINEGVKKSSLIIPHSTDLT